MDWILKYYLDELNIPVIMQMKNFNRFHILFERAKAKRQLAQMGG
jgi:hypothetical protein